MNIRERFGTLCSRLEVEFQGLRLLTTDYHSLAQSVPLCSNLNTKSWLSPYHCMVNVRIDNIMTTTKYYIGRVEKAYYPATEALGSKTTFNKAFYNISSTVSVYVLDRAIKVTLPDYAVTETAYSLERSSHALVISVKDVLGNVQTTHTSGSGKTTATPTAHYIV